MPISTHALSLLWCGLTAYSPNGTEVKNIPDFLTTYQEPVSTSISDFETGPSRWLLHIHFRGNDFGFLKDSGTKTVLEGLSNSSKRHPFRQLELSSQASALELNFYYRNEKVLGQMRYRHESADRALLAIKELYGCTAISEDLQKTYLVVSGGSHGASFMNAFIRKLRKDCGKRVDFVIAKDAMAYPHPISMQEFSNLPENVPCLNSFQQNPFSGLMGQPVKSCYNFKVVGFSAASHGYVENAGYLLVKKILRIMDP